MPPRYNVKESVFPFIKFPGVDIILSPEMKSTGEVMGIDDDFARAFYKSQEAAFTRLPTEGKVFISVKKSDKEKIIPLAKSVHGMGFTIFSTGGTAKVLQANGIPATPVLKIAEGSPNISDMIRNMEIKLIINTPSGKGPMLDEAKIRSLAVSFDIPCITTLKAAQFAIQGLKAVQEKGLSVGALQDYHQKAPVAGKL